MENPKGQAQRGNRRRKPQGAPTRMDTRGHKKGEKAKKEHKGADTRGTGEKEE